MSRWQHFFNIHATSHATWAVIITNKYFYCLSTNGIYLLTVICSSTCTKQPIHFAGSFHGVGEHHGVQEARAGRSQGAQSSPDTSSPAPPPATSSTVVVGPVLFVPRSLSFKRLAATTTSLPFFLCNRHIRISSRRGLLEGLP